MSGKEEPATVELLVTYMAMNAAPSAAPRRAPESAAVAVERLGVVDYRALYRAVGEAVQWDERLRLGDAALAAILEGPATEIHVLRLGGEAVGFCELDLSQPPRIEIVYFGIVPAVQGRGLGPFLLDRALRAAWARGPERVWLHTDTNDHPGARATYERAGFAAYLSRMERFPA